MVEKSNVSAVWISEPGEFGFVATLLGRHILAPMSVDGDAMVAKNSGFEACVGTDRCRHRGLEQDFLRASIHHD
jgi:hypothetical protein